MKISYTWLKDYLPVNLPPEKVAEILTDTGLEVEGTEEIETVQGGLRGVVIGQVLTCEPHPNADRLKKTTVDIGAGEPLEIVCGAPNVAAGQKVPVATVGTKIYTDEGEFTIKKSKIRGEVSEGMICAEDELNLGQSHDGIMVLDDDAKVGQSATEYFDIQTDTVFEIGLTPNRTDAMCHYGVARDLRAALLQKGEKTGDLQLPSVEKFAVQNRALPIDIVIEDEAACPRYAGVSIKNVKVQPSPDWLQNRLRAIGLGPINNVVDITNYILHETGHPLHAFDVQTITGNKIIVKTLPDGTKFTTLDDKERTLHEDDLMICNVEEGMVIAGIFGGKKSGVTENTTDIFLEAAWFDPVSIRKTAKRHGLNTDASFRYERGVDPEMTMYALKRAALLVQEIAGGEVSMDILDVHPQKIEGAKCTLNLQRMRTLIGQEIPENEVRQILQSLDIEILSESGDDWQLKVPAYRMDVTREADVVEEVLRIYGFNAIAVPEKMRVSVAQTDPKDEARFREKISAGLAARGFHEIMNNSLTKPQYFEKHGFDAKNSVEMLNPLSQDLAVLRQSLVFGGLETIARNANRQRADLKLFEFGKTYQNQDGKYSEKEFLALWMTGSENPENWKNENQPSDFFYLKSEIEIILKSLGISEWEENEVSSEIFDFSLEISTNKKPLFFIGKLKPSFLKETDVKQDVFYAEADWKVLAKKAAKNSIPFQELPKYPAVRRDLALLLDKKILYSDLKKSAQNSERKILRNVNLFDVYEGEKLPSDKKSYALSFTLRDDSKTLNDKQVEKTMEKILGNFKKEFAAELR